MRTHYFRCISFVCALGLGGSLLAADAKPDLTSPKKAATAFALSLQKGDFASLKSVTTGTESDYKLMQTITGMTAAANKLHDAAIAKFGEDGKKIAVGTGDPSDIPRQIEDSEEKVTGNSATILKKGASEGNSVKLNKVGSEWKVDLAQYPQKDQISLQAPMLDATSKVLTQAASDVSAGKYHSATEASQEIQQQMMAVMASMMKGVQPPTTAPARR